MRRKILFFGFIGLFSLVVLTLLFAHGSDGTYQTSKSTGTYKNKSGRFTMIIVYKTNSNSYEVTMTGRVNGWLSVGFGRTKVMKDAEIIMGYVKDNQGYIFHEYGTGPVTHQLIKKLDSFATNSIIKLLFAEEKGDTTTIKFSRPLNAVGKYYKKFERGKKIEFMYGISQKDDSSVQHGERGALDIILP